MVYKTRVLIIGSGPAGLTAAIYAARAGVEPIVVAGWEAGGQLQITTDVENYPGFADIIQGPWLMEQMRLQAEKVGTRIHTGDIVSVNLNQRPFLVYGSQEQMYEANTIIIATGAKAKWLGIESETQFRGHGISGCATCDGFFFKNQDVIVVGGGNTAVEEALYLTRHARAVTLIHRRDHLRAEKVLQERLFNNPKIKAIWNTQIEEFLGSEEGIKQLTGARLYNTQTGEKSDISCTGAFIAIGHAPATDLFVDQLKCDSTGYILCSPGTVNTSIAGVFACGDVQDSVYRQAITAAGQGCMAALDAIRYLDEMAIDPSL